MNDARAIGSHRHDSHRQRARRIVDALPADCSYDDVLRALAFDRQLRRGLADERAGRLVTTEALRHQLRSWRD